MKTYRCTSCGAEIQRETLPLKCPNCKRQAIGLFKLVTGSHAPASPTAPPAVPGPPHAPGNVPPPLPAAPPPNPAGPPPAKG